MATVLHERCDRLERRHRLHWVDVPVTQGADATPSRCPGTPLPYPQCRPEQHESYGGACYECCPTCDQADHRCPGCGEELRHDGTEWTDARARHDCLPREEF